MSRSDELDLILLRMRGGDLFELSKSERRNLIASVCEPKKVNRNVAASYQRLAPLRKIDPRTMLAFQDGIRTDGEALGEKILAGGNLEVLWYPKPGVQLGADGAVSGETDEKVAPLIREYVWKRIGNYSRGYSSAKWHTVNIILFFVWIGSREGFSEAADLLLLVWWISWLLMYSAWARIHLSSKSLYSIPGYSAQFSFLEVPLKEGVSLVLSRGISEKQSEAPDFSWLKRKNVSAVEKRGSRASSWQAAEKICAEWLTSKTSLPARVTRGGPDGGVDIRGVGYVCQVKNYKGSVPVQAIRELHGIAASEENMALFFSSGTFTRAAIDFANSVNMPLITYYAGLNQFEGANYAGKSFVGT